VAQAFKLADFPDPRLDNKGKFAYLLQRQLRHYLNNDPPDRQQAAVTGSILREYYKLSKSSNSDRALCELFIGTFFFAMRSCEYVKVSGTRKTKLLTIGNIRFYLNNKEIKHNNEYLHLSGCVSITFEHQKRDTKNDTITQHKSGDKTLCPVRIWASIIKRITSYSSTTNTTTVNTYLLSNNKLHLFSGTELLKRLRFTST
jgi:hypothetical protein